MKIYPAPSVAGNCSALIQIALDCSGSLPLLAPGLCIRRYRATVAQPTVYFPQVAAGRSLITARFPRTTQHRRKPRVNNLHHPSHHAHQLTRAQTKVDTSPGRGGETKLCIDCRWHFTESTKKTSGLDLGGLSFKFHRRNKHPIIAYLNLFYTPWRHTSIATRPTCTSGMTAMLRGDLIPRGETRAAQGQATAQSAQ
jgi:hypothetical protein